VALSLAWSRLSEHCSLRRGRLQKFAAFRLPKGQMLKLTFLTSITALIVLGLILELLRRRQLREKYAFLWMSVGLVVLILGFLPRLLDSVAALLGVASGVSLVLFLGVIFLLLVSIHLSWEVSRLEEETRMLAEEIALIRTEFTRQPGELVERRQVE
jgi:hypothetical protein